MLRPQWILALVLALLVAGAFAWLGRWQLERAVQSNVAATGASETVVPLSTVARPGSAIRDDVTGQKVTVRGTFSAADYRLVGDRLNKGAVGYWVVGHLTVDRENAGQTSTVALAVARGWSASRDAATSAMRALARAGDEPVVLTGRLLPTEAPVPPDPKGDPQAMTTVSVAALINVWSEMDNADAYEAYLVQKGAPAGLTAIDSPPPIAQNTVNWLNIFYAVEWVVFAGFAVYMWYRLTKDAYERAVEEANGPSAGSGTEVGRGTGESSRTEGP
ncbi:MAG: SURF1 family protein [Microbacteriaceae bacterium]